MLWLFVGCGTGSGLVADSTSPDAVGSLDGFAVELDPVLPNVVRASWAGGTGRGRVEYGLDDALDRSTPWGEPDAASVLGLKSGRRYQMRAVDEDADGARWVSETVEVEIPAAPPELPAFTIDESDSAAWAGDGLVLVTIFDPDGSWVAVLDREGDYVWMTRPKDHEAVPTVHVTRDGRGVVYTDDDADGYGWGGIGHLTFDGSIDEYRTLPAVHHDVVDLPDGGYAWLEFETRTVVLEDGTSQEVTSDAVFDATDFEGEPRRVFSMFDDYGHPPWHICTHSEEIIPVAGGTDFTHGNSLIYDEAGDRYLYMARNLDALIGIDRASGERQFQAGGRFGDFVDEAGDTLDPEDPSRVDGPNQTWWSHAHMSAAWDGGFALFDNGYHHSPPLSRAAAYAWDPDARTLRRTFAFTSETGQFDPVLGDVRPLDNGDWLIGFTIEGMVIEVTPQGKVVWRASAALGGAIGRIGYLSSLYGEE